MSEPKKYPSPEALATLLKPAFGFMDAMSLKCVVQLGIPDIIRSHGRPVSLTQIATQLGSNNLNDLRCLTRVMDILTRKGIFTSTIINPKNPKNLENHENLENAGKSENSENLENLQNSENHENSENLQNPENAEDSENPENRENSKNHANPENPENRENSENLENLQNPKNAEDSENLENRENGIILYDLTPSSELLLKDNYANYSPIILMLNNIELLAPLHYLSSTIKEGGLAFEKAHNCPIWEYLANNKEVNKVFHDGLACTAKIGFGVIVTEYKDVFATVETVVDVGGGTGTTAFEIVRAHPHIKAINFDLPHVIGIAPKYDGVTHVTGDMFEAIPNADVVILKSILHDWDDEDCIKILKNCRKAVPEKTGKIILFEQLVLQEGEGPIDDIVYASDLLMIAHTGGGKERTEAQCKTLLLNSGFKRSRFIGVPGLPSIIEGYVE